jgi:hypothetical protein
MEPIPKNIILNVRKEFLAFEQNVTPWISRSTVTAADLVSFMWEAFFDKGNYDEQLIAAIYDTTIEFDFVGLVNNGTVISEPMYEFARALHEEIQKHDFYGKRGYLPFYLNVTPQKLVVLNYNDILDDLEQDA